MLPSWMVRLWRARALQPLHERLHHAALVGMNYGGGSITESSGERAALRHAASLLRDEGSPVIFDVGAHYGSFTKAALAEFGDRATVHAFEPSAAARAVFETNRLGALQSGRAVLLPFGLAANKGAARLHAPVEGWSIATLHADAFADRRGAMKAEDVELRTMDEYCSHAGIERVHYLKLDTEGHELEVLRGAGRMLAEGRVDMVQFEFGEADLFSRVFFRDLHALLAPRYALHRILSGGLWPIDAYKPELEIFRTANYLAIAHDLVGRRKHAHA